MKRKIALVLVLALALALCACGSRNLQPDEVQLPEENTQNASPGHCAYVQGSGINLRAGVGTGTDIIDVVNIADKVYVIGEENGWTKVIFNNKVGYIYSPFVSTTYPIVNNEIVPNTPSNEGNATIIDPSGNSTVISGGGADSAGTGVIVLG